MSDERLRPRDPHSADEELLEADTLAIVSQLDDAARVRRMAAEIEMGFDRLRPLRGHAVSIFGSARTPADSPEYAAGRTVARRLGEEGFAIITGGGPGLMEAANRGALDAGALSVGLGIDLPGEPGLNPYVGIPLEFHYFFARKIMFVRYARAFVVLPGGIGTGDELFEAWTLVQTEKIRHFPIVLFGSDYWGGLLDWMREAMLAGGKVSPGDLDIVHLTDDPEEVCRIVCAAEELRPPAP
ncbi:TIGR00730 family Rossman fold protein [Conexibacter sp. SYSU D00693]|uniref:LOG family protein n=1 Tax=Conexibacter sp. SYSU D00693 TaxID=2812560 RepID=UPI001F119A6A|nr:TIGR00730 family Rossman fold protein [Conexibacter sp. SYSU D00693]